MTAVQRHAFLTPYALACSPADADGAFLAKLMPVFQNITGLGADDSDDQTVKLSTEFTDTTYGGDVFFNLTRCVLDRSRLRHSGIALTRSVQRHLRHHRHERVLPLQRVADDATVQARRGTRRGARRWRHGKQISSPSRRKPRH